MREWKQKQQRTSNPTNQACSNKANILSYSIHMHFVPSMRVSASDDVHMFMRICYVFCTLSVEFVGWTKNVYSIGDKRWRYAYTQHRHHALEPIEP